MKEMRPIVVSSIVALLVTIAVPWYVSSYAGEAGMMVSFLLFYSIDPIMSIEIGAIAGRNVKKLFWLIFLMPILFLIGACVFFTATEPVFWLYALIYLGLSAITMIITAFIIKKFKS